MAALSGEQGWNDQRADVEGRALRHTTLVMVACALALAPILLIGLPLVYGEDFRPAATLAVLLLPGVACLGVGSVLISATSGRGRPRYAMINGLITTRIAIALYVVLINADQATGAAIASTLAYVCSFVIAVNLLPSYDRHFAPPVASDPRRAARLPARRDRAPPPLRLNSVRPNSETLPRVPALKALTCRP